ncbi:cobalt transporter CbiM [Methanothermobacter thermautotrophicus]|uniref:Cobalt transporter CbiM n=1 Tax=Methanothermobacter thermautotrophicus TaxID=145262 RepID=A0A842YK85_METTF|nr:cobalt transporter CbiM [Methanothermobacter thermautotrophicus]MBE2899739.1 cobalt transporter CbiM [Methanothermobacter thermautotrophicus]MCQ8904743.1 cobalt transporter CbiM [Methanothermobacter sp.]
MHIPDGFIPFPQYLVYWVIALVALYFSMQWARRDLKERQIPLFAVLAAGIFAIQAMNIPIPWGTSGHMVGAALVAIIFASPWAAVLLLSIVLILQGLIFGDGGITALGANIFNMGIIGGFAGYYLFQALRSAGEIPAVILASWASIFLAAIACAVEMWIAGTFPLVPGLWMMGLYHAVIGIIEAAITVVVVLAIQSTRPDLFSFRDWGKKSAEVSSK